MKIFLTGIAKTDKKGFIQDTLDIAKKNGKTVKYISMGDLLKKRLESDLGATFVPENILNIDEEFLALSIKGIINELKEEAKKHENLIIGGHALFYWKKNFTNAFNWECLKDINPDMFITLIDNSERLQKNMAKSRQWASQEMTVEEILSWQGIEVNTVMGWSQLMKKQHYILPRSESRGLLYKLMFTKAELVYASFPMSFLKAEVDRKRIDDFVVRLNEYFAVLNPRSIELAPSFRQAEAAQTFQRDLRWFTGKAKKIVVMFLPDLVFSAGVLTEINHAFQTSKEVFMISPKKDYGPFEKHLVSKMFHSEDEFFKYIEEKGYKRLGIKY